MGSYYFYWGINLLYLVVNMEGLYWPLKMYVSIANQRKYPDGDHPANIDHHLSCKLLINSGCILILHYELQAFLASEARYMQEI